MLTATVRPLMSAVPQLGVGALRSLELPYHPPPDGLASIRNDEDPSGSGPLVPVSEKPRTSQIVSVASTEQAFMKLPYPPLLRDDPTLLWDVEDPTWTDLFRGLNSLVDDVTFPSVAISIISISMAIYIGTWGSISGVIFFGSTSFTLTCLFGGKIADRLDERMLNPDVKEAYFDGVRARASDGKVSAMATLCRAEHEGRLPPQHGLAALPDAVLLDPIIEGRAALADMLEALRHEKQRARFKELLEDDPDAALSFARRNLTRPQRRTLGLTEKANAIIYGIIVRGFAANRALNDEAFAYAFVEALS